MVVCTKYLKENILNEISDNSAMIKVVIRFHHNPLENIVPFINSISVSICMTIKQKKKPSNINTDRNVLIISSTIEQCENS